jgi:hypothetical protein
MTIKRKNLITTFAATVTLAIMIFAAGPAKAAILFQNDNFATIDSTGMILNNDNESSSDIIVQFGQTLAKTLKYSTSNSRFEFNAGLDLNNFQLTTARMENVTAMPGGAGGLGAGGTGRIVELTATDAVAPGCTGPSCSPGTYSWNGAIWKPLQGSVTTSTATKIVTVGPTARDYTTIALAAAYCNTLSGCEMWIDPGTYPVTTVVDLENTKLIGADGNGITQISISGAGKLLVKDTFFYELNINVGAITGTIGLDVKYNAASSSSSLFSKVNFSTTAGKYVLGSTAGTAPTTIINFMNCAEAAADPGAFINLKASAGLNSATSAIYVINLLTKDPLKISDWPVSIVGGSNVVTTGTITSVPDRTIYVSQDMDINNAIQSLISSGGGGVVKLLVGTHTITSPIIVNSSNIAVVGEGPGTIINVPSAGWTGGTGATVAAIQVGAAAGTAPVNNVIVRDLVVQVEPDIHGIKVNGGSENKLIDTVVKSTGAKSTTHTAIVFTDSTTSAGVRMTASRNIVNRDDSITNPGCGTASPGNHCWVDGIHFDGDAALVGQLFGYGNGLQDSIISENIVNEVQQTCYAFSKVKASGIFSNRARNIGYNTGGGAPFGLFVNNANDVSVINNTVETNNFTSTIGIGIYGNVQNSTFIGNTINSGGVANYAIAIDFRTGSTASNDNIVTSNEIIGATTGINIGTGHLRNIVTDNKFANTTTYVTDSGTYTKLETLHHQDTVNPTVNDDITRDYRVGTMWINTVTNVTFVITNSTAGAAVWTATSGATHTQNTDTGTNATNFTLNNGNTNANTTLTFGGTTPQTLTYNPTNIRFDLSKDLNITGNLTTSGNTLLGTTGTANTRLDINGDLALRSSNVTAVNGANNNLVIGAFSNIRITGPTAPFSITGLAGGVNGKIVTLFNTTAQPMTIANNSGSSLAANRIITNTNADHALLAGGTVTLTYDSTLSSWVQTAGYGNDTISTAALTLVNGTNADIALGNAVYFRISGPTALFNLNGFAGGINGRQITLFNSTNQPMVIHHEDTVNEATAANRITTVTGADIYIGGANSPNTYGAVTLIYDGVSSRWIVLSYNGTSKYNLTVATGNNNNVDVNSALVVEIATDPGGNFTITGILPNTDGAVLTIRNKTARNMTIANESGSSTAANRITTNTGGNIYTVGAGTVTMYYDYNDQRWVITATTT